jgi:hypothetical protein
MRVTTQDAVIARSASDEAIQSFVHGPGLLRFARNDGNGGGSPWR